VIIPRNRRQEYLSQPAQPFEGETADEIDALLASAITDKNAIESYFDVQSDGSSFHWQSVPSSFSSSISGMYTQDAAGQFKPRQDSLESEPAPVSADDDAFEEMSNSSLTSESDKEPTTPPTSTDHEAASSSSSGTFTSLTYSQSTDALRRNAKGSFRYIAFETE
jgi:hypothetical protein